MSEFGLVGKDFLQMDLREFAKLALFFEQFPREARVATAQFLNDMGFAAKRNVPIVLAEHMHIRNQKFVGSRIRVEKTTAKPIAEQRVTVGSIPGDRFTGWIEQQRGATPERSRVFSLLARGGSEEEKAKPSSRLKPGTDFPDPSQWDEMPGIATPSRMLQFMVRELAGGMGRMSGDINKPFIVPRGHGVAPGLYKIKRGSASTYRKSRRAGKGVGNWAMSAGRPVPKILMLQRFGKQPRPARWPWIQDVIAYTIKHAPIASMWQAAMDRAWQRMHGLK